MALSNDRMLCESPRCYRLALSCPVCGLGGPPQLPRHLKMEEHYLVVLLLTPARIAIAAAQIDKH